MEFDFAVIADHARFLASGVGVTLLLAALSGATSLATGFVVGPAGWTVGSGSFLS